MFVSKWSLLLLRVSTNLVPQNIGKAEDHWKRGGKGVKERTQRKHG